MRADLSRLLLCKLRSHSKLAPSAPAPPSNPPENRSIFDRSSTAVATAAFRAACRATVVWSSPAPAAPQSPASQCPTAFPERTPVPAAPVSVLPPSACMGFRCGRGIFWRTSFSTPGSAGGAIVEEEAEVAGGGVPATGLSASGDAGDTAEDVEGADGISVGFPASIKSRRWGRISL